MILEPPASVQKLQTALQAKAKEAPDYRFYLLYDKYRKDVLEYATPIEDETASLSAILLDDRDRILSSAG
jgi:hypothetical protein